MNAELHLYVACSYFSLGQSEPREVAVKVVTLSPKQESHGISIKLQCSYSVETMLFQ